MRTPLDECLKKFVVIEAGGIKYMGTLIEVGEEEVILKSPARWIGVPIDRITSIKQIDQQKHENPQVEHVDAEEYVAAPDTAVSESAPEAVAEPEETEAEDRDRPPTTNK